MDDLEGARSDERNERRSHGEPGQGGSRRSGSGPGPDTEREHAPRRYTWTFAALLVLTTITLALVFVELGPAGTPSALAIALVKAVLVALFFMHLTEHRTSSWLTLVVAVLLAGTLLTLAVLDVATRAA